MYIKIGRFISKNTSRRKDKVIKPNNLTGTIFRSGEPMLIDNFTISSNPDSVVSNYTNNNCAMLLRERFLDITNDYKENSEYYFIRIGITKTPIGEIFYFGKDYIIIGLREKGWDIDISPDNINWFHWIGEKCILK